MMGTDSPSEATYTGSYFYSLPWRRAWQPTPLFLLPSPSLLLLVLMLLLSNLICIHIIHPGGTPIRGKSAELTFTEIGRAHV